MSTSVKIKSRYKNWDKDILPEILKQEQIHRSQGIPATIRGLLYIFEGIILEKKDYGGLSKHLVAWRERNKIKGDWIVDKQRRIIDIVKVEYEGERIVKVFDEKHQTAKNLITPLEHIDCGIDYLKHTAEDIHNHIPKWLGQPKYLEVWVEKSAMGSVISSILKNEGIDVVVAPNSGWSSYTFAEDNLNRLLKMQVQEKDVFVQYYGDSDPTGERMTAEDSKMVQLLENNGIHFERIAITDKTIKDFKLERFKKIRDPNTLHKLTHKDPNRHWFMSRHDGQVWQIEVDALQTDMNRFKRLVVSNTRRHYETKIYDKVVKQVKETWSLDYIKDRLKEQVKELSESL